MKTFEKITNYFKEAFAELKKIVWPTRKQALILLVTVIVFSLVVASFLGGMDYLITKLLQFILSKK